MIEEKLGRYSIVKTLGSGSMGTVFMAEDRRSGRRAAVKLIRSRVLYDMDLRERFLQRALAASEIRHKGICPILEIGDDENDFYVITPFLEGVTLKQRLEAGPLPPGEALRVSAEIAQALAALHAGGVIHGGVRPANIWIRPDGSIVIVDCGLARLTGIDKEEQRRPGRNEPDISRAPMSTLAYLSPEQIRGDKVDHRTDVFSWGAVLYEMLTGSHPFDRRSSPSCSNALIESSLLPATAFVADLPAWLEDLLDKSMDRSPLSRPQSMWEVLSELGREVPSATAGLLEALPEEAPGTALFGYRMVAAVLLLGILASLVLSVGFLFR